jgi:aspartate-semialdehyde dehydrogenase
LIEKKENYNVAVAGATGAVGRKMLEILEERKFPVNRLKLLASARSAGQSLEFLDDKFNIEELRHDSFEGVDIALFSAGAGVSREFAPFAVKSNCVVIDNSSAYRMESDIPLVVPEVNPDAIGKNPGIVANPNCSTIQMVIALKPIHDKFKIKRVVVSTYQSVSGSGQKAIDELKDQTYELLQGNESKPNVYPHQIAFNCIPHIDNFLDNGYSKEEMKMVNETRKIFNDDSIQVCPTTVRVPVFYSHSEALNVETEGPVTASAVKDLLTAQNGVCVIDEPENNLYPLAITGENKDQVFVGRIRDDISRKRAVNLWVVSDNLRKGAALNAVQIAELLIADP